MFITAVLVSVTCLLTTPGFLVEFDHSIPSHRNHLVLQSAAHFCCNSCDFISTDFQAKFSFPWHNRCFLDHILNYTHVLSVMFLWGTQRNRGIPFPKCRSICQSASDYTQMHVSLSLLYVDLQILYPRFPQDRQPCRERRVREAPCPMGGADPLCADIITGTGMSQFTFRCTRLSLLQPFPYIPCFDGCINTFRRQGLVMQLILIAHGLNTCKSAYSQTLTYNSKSRAHSTAGSFPHTCEYVHGVRKRAIQASGPLRSKWGGVSVSSFYSHCEQYAALRAMFCAILCIL